jgi:hypothetical protein
MRDLSLAGAVPGYSSTFDAGRVPGARARLAPPSQTAIKVPHSQRTVSALCVGTSDRVLSAVPRGTRPLASESFRFRSLGLGLWP